MASQNQMIHDLNNMTLNETVSSRKFDPNSFLGKILTSIESQNSKLTALDSAYIRLQLVINKHPNAVHNKKIPYLQKEFKDAKKHYNTLLEKRRAEIVH